VTSRHSAGGSVTLTADTSQFRELFAKSSQVDAKLKTALRKRIRVAAKTAATASKQAVTGSYRTRAAAPTSRGLRANIAAGITVGILTGNSQVGVTITASGKHLAAGQRSLPRRWDSGRGWRHPTFGNTNAWRTQFGSPYFYKVITAHQPAVTAAVELAMKDAVNSLEQL
jgi:hypothetical protein